MSSQQLADEMATLAGWTREVKPMRCSKRIHPSGSTDVSFWVCAGQADEFNHPYPVGSIDRLEAFRRERLPGWEIGLVKRIGEDLYRVRLVREQSFVETRDGPDEWTARASALIAAAKENKPNV